MQVAGTALERSQSGSEQCWFGEEETGAQYTGREGVEAGHEDSTQIKGSGPAAGSDLFESSGSKEVADQDRDPGCTEAGGA